MDEQVEDDDPGTARAIREARMKAAILLQVLPNVEGLPAMMRWVRSMMEVVDQRGAGIDLDRVREALRDRGFVPNMHVPLRAPLDRQVRGEWLIGQFLAALPGVPSRFFRAFDVWIEGIASEGAS